MSIKRKSRDCLMLENLNFNLFGLIIVVVMLSPNVLFYFIKKDYFKNRMIENKSLEVAEQISRYATMILMVISLSNQKMTNNRETLYIISVSIMTVLYVWLWRAYFVRENDVVRILLAIVPSIIFIVSGFLRYDYLLLVFGVIFGISHTLVTKKEKN